MKTKELYVRCWENFKKALLGEALWRELLWKHHANNDTAVILFPSADDVCVGYAIKHLSAFLHDNGYKEALLLSCFQGIEGLITEHGVQKKVLDIVFLSSRQAECLLAYYNANMRDDRFVVASLTIPDGRILTRYLSCGLIFEEELFLAAIYNMSTDSEDDG